VSEVQVGNVRFGNNLPMVLLGGINVIESRDLAMSAAEAFVSATGELGIPYIFKASFDKANRSSAASFRGPGLDEGLKILQEVATTFAVPVVTDVHEAGQASAVAEVCSLLQVPAFLARQTDLLAAMAATGRPLHVKKPQYMSPTQAGHIVNKLAEYGAREVILCERGTSFGYDNLVVDMLGFDALKQAGGQTPVTFDVTHALQMRESGSAVSGGRRRQVSEFARSGLAIGLAGLFLEAHPDPDSALCDGPSALPLDLLHPFLAQMKAVDDLVKSLPAVEIL
jgi:2-dehydro-3-deoxyphosphooctonate aldolase (KDO 8-P synthase)